MLYEFVCDSCGKSAVIKASITNGPPTFVGCELCHPESKMRRLYNSQPRPIIQLDTVGYIEKAYRGEEAVPGLTTPQVRAIVDTQVRTNHAGRMNNARRQRRY